MANALPGLKTEATLTDVRILYAINGAERQCGVTIASGQGAVAIGTVLGMITASGKFGKYNDTLGDGTQTAVGICMTQVDATSEDCMADMLVGNALIIKAALTGYDAAAKVDLGAREILGATVVNLP